MEDKIENWEDLEYKIANWRTSSELEDTCALWTPPQLYMLILDGQRGGFKKSHCSKTMGMIFEGLEEMFKGDLSDTCSKNEYL